MPTVETRRLRIQCKVECDELPRHESSRCLIGLLIVTVSEEGHEDVGAGFINHLGNVVLRLRTFYVRLKNNAVSCARLTPYSLVEE